MATPVQATDLGMYVNDVLVACAQTASMTINRDMLEAVCAGSGNWREVSPGTVSWEGSIDALWRVIPTGEATTNVNVNNLFDLLVAGTSTEIRFGFKDGSNASLAGYQLSGNAFFTSLDLSNPTGDSQTWTASFTGSGPLTRIAVPA